MDEQHAREILGDAIDGKGLYTQNLCWEFGDATVEIDGEYTADELEAIAWWMRNMSDVGAPTMPPGPYIGERVMLCTLLRDGHFPGKVVHVHPNTCLVKLDCQEQIVSSVLYFADKPEVLPASYWQACWPDVGAPTKGLVLNKPTPPPIPPGPH